MKKVISYIAGAAATLMVSGTVFLTGCSVKAMPSNVPLVKNVQTKSFSGVSVSLINAEKDSAAYDIPTDRGQTLGFIGNRRMWSKQLVDNLAGELAQRGASVAPKALLRLSISLPEITLIEHDPLYQFKVKVAVSSKGWTKQYEAVAESRLGFFENADDMAGRAAGLALAQAIKIILDDSDFLTQVGQNKSPRIELGSAR